VVLRIGRSRNCRTAVVCSAVEVVDVSFVHGHPRRTGWVVAHVRRPSRAEPGQLPLLLVVPPPRGPVEDGGDAASAEPGRSARKSAITRS
jgi:hypothetical protein